MSVDKVGGRRLLKLAAFLAKLPRKRFYYGHWVGQKWKGKADLSCGTTACALGWATTMPAFRKLGLRLGQDWTGARAVVLSGQYTQSAAAAMEVFRIDAVDAHYLFFPAHAGLSSKATPKRVAKHIRDFVKRELR